jgi:hypothetical protein
MTWFHSYISTRYASIHIFMKISVTIRLVLLLTINTYKNSSYCLLFADILKMCRVIKSTVVNVYKSYLYGIKVLF